MVCLRVSGTSSRLDPDPGAMQLVVFCLDNSNDFGSDSTTG